MFNERKQIIESYDYMFINFFKCFTDILKTQLLIIKNTQFEKNILT